MLNSTTITLESDIKNVKEVEKFLQQYCTIYSSIERTLFNRLKNEENISTLFNELQREYVLKYNIHARLFKSIWRRMIGRIQSLVSNNENYIVQKRTKIKKLNKKLENIKNEFYIFRIESNINKLNQYLENGREIQSVWGSKKFFKSQWSDEYYKNCQNEEEIEKLKKEYKDNWREEWKIRRDYNMLVVGSSDENFGNSLFQLQTLNKLRITLPREFEQRRLDIEVDFNKDKKIYNYLKLAIANRQALTIRIFQSPLNKKWYVQISFTLSNECRNLNNGTIGVDINYNVISTCRIKKDGNQEQFKNYDFEVDNQNSDENRRIFSEIVNQIVDDAFEHRKIITIEEINLKNVIKNKEISLVCYNTFISLLRARCIKMGVLLIEINPKYTSIIGGLKYQKRFGVCRHQSASYCIGRRGLNYVEKIPSGYIYLLHGEEKDKSLLDQWNLINKRLQKVSQDEKSLYLHSVYRDQTNCDFESYSVSFANE